MTELPQGWAETALGDVCELLNGRAYSQHELLSEGKYPVLRVGNLFSRNAWYHSDLELDPDKYIDSGDLIYAWSASFGPRIWQGGKVIYHYHIWKCALQDQAVDKLFLYNLLLWDTAKIKGDHGVGSTMMHVTKSAMEKRQIPLPPLPEQRRIVRKLDTLSARSTTARTHLTAIEKLVERYKLAVLRGAFFVDASGTLNEEEAAACGWDVRPLGQSLENLDNRRIPIKAEDRKKRQGPYDYYGASGVIDKIDEYLFDGRYLLIGEDGANLVARSSPIAFIAEGKFWVNNHAHVLGETHDACLDWVRLYFAAIKLEPFVTGSAQPKLTQANLNKIPVPLPTPEEQREIVRRIETAFAKIDRLAAEAAKALKLLGHLDQRILAKAFAGDLVPQDPTDEPAETLLARIRETRAASPKGRKRRSA